MGHVAVLASAGGDGVARFGQHKPDMVLTDLKMEGADGIVVLDKVREEDPDAVVMIMTGFGSVKTAVDAMKKGAFDFVEKPFSPDVLRAKITAGLQLREERRRVERVEALADVHAEDAAERYSLQREQQGEKRKVKGILGKAKSMEPVFKAIEKVAASSTTVYIHGESGTGKELVARAIHDLSARKDGPF